MILESKGPKTDRCGAPEKKTGDERVSKCVQKIADRRDNYVTSLTVRKPTSTKCAK